MWPKWLGSFNAIEMQCYGLRYYNLRNKRTSIYRGLGFQIIDANLYRYVINQPSRLIDPLGMMAMVEEITIISEDELAVAGTMYAEAGLPVSTYLQMIGNLERILLSPTASLQAKIAAFNALNELFAIVPYHLKVAIQLVVASWTGPWW